MTSNPSLQREAIVAVTGHRRLKDLRAVSAGIAEAFDQLERA